MLDESKFISIHTFCNKICEFVCQRHIQILELKGETKFDIYLIQKIIA